MEDVNRLLVPFSKAIMGLQGKSARLSNASRYWIHLSNEVGKFCSQTSWKPICLPCVSNVAEQIPTRCFASLQSLIFENTSVTLNPEPGKNLSACNCINRGGINAAIIVNYRSKYFHYMECANAKMISAEQSTGMQAIFNDEPIRRTNYYHLSFIKTCT